MQFDLDTILKIAGALVPVFSALGSFFNHIVRQQQAEGKDVAPALLGANTVVNAVALNVDKAIQMSQLFKAATAKPVEEPKAE